MCLGTSRAFPAPWRASVRCRAHAADRRANRTDRSPTDRRRFAPPATGRCAAIAPASPSRRDRGRRVRVSAGRALCSHFEQHVVHLTGGVAMPFRRPPLCVVIVPVDAGHPVDDYQPRARAGPDAPNAAPNPPPAAGVTTLHRLEARPRHYSASVDRYSRQLPARPRQSATAARIARRLSVPRNSLRLVPEHAVAMWWFTPTRVVQSGAESRRRRPQCYGFSSSRINDTATVPTTCMLSRLTLSSVSSSVWWYG